MSESNYFRDCGLIIYAFISILFQVSVPNTFTYIFDILFASWRMLKLANIHAQKHNIDI